MEQQYKGPVTDRRIRELFADAGDFNYRTVEICGFPVHTYAIDGLTSGGDISDFVIRPLLESDAGLVISHGICPKFSDYDTYWMMANAMDEAIRNAVATLQKPFDPEELLSIVNRVLESKDAARKAMDGE